MDSQLQPSSQPLRMETTPVLQTNTAQEMKMPQVQHVPQVQQTTQSENYLTIEQSVQVLHQAVVIGQKAGVYSLDDSALIKVAIDSLRTRLGMDK